MHFARSLFTVSSLTVISRVAGFVRDTLTAMFLGAGPVADAFFVAQRLPNLFRSLFAEGAFSAAFVPLYTTEQERHGDEAAQHFAGQALALLLATLIPFSVLIMMFMPQVMLVLAPGFENTPEKYNLAVAFQHHHLSLSGADFSHCVADRGFKRARAFWPRRSGTNCLQHRADRRLVRGTYIPSACRLCAGLGGDDFRRGADGMADDQLLSRRCYHSAGSAATRRKRANVCSSA